MTDAAIYDRLVHVGLRPTRQRLMIGSKLWGGNWATTTRHLTAEQLHNECLRDGAHVSMATIYNTLHHFVKSGLLKEVVVSSSCSYFDTNVSHHYHLLDESTGELFDVDEDAITLHNLPEIADGKSLQRIDIVLRIASA